MVNRGRRAFRLGLSATAGASVLGLTTWMTGPAAHAEDTALILGGSGIPTPPQSYVDAAENLYLGPNGYGSYTPQALTTPEQFYPVTGVNSLTPDASVAQGVTILTNTIGQQIAAGNNVVVFGYSQSSDIASQVAANLAASPNPPSPGQLSFVLVGDEANPNGGIVTRFEVPGTPLALPALGSTFNFAPTTGSPYPTSVYSLEYDGFADFPQYPLNLLSDLNAFVGVFTEHFGYVDLTPAQISSAVQLPTTGGSTSYYMVPTTNLGLLDLVRLIPLVGDPVADLLQPDLSILVNLGYGSITNGWSPGPANVPTPFGLLPTNINLSDLATALVNGIPQGITAALNDLKSPQLLDLSSLSLFLSGLNTAGFTPSATPSLTQLLAGFATIGNGGVPVSSSDIGTTLLNDLGVVGPIANTALTLVGSLPQYDAQLFTSQLASGNLLNAVGLPIAADIGLGLYSLIFGGVFPVVGAGATTLTELAELTGLAPNPAAATPAAPTPAAATLPPAVSTAAITPASTAPTAAPAKTAAPAVTPATAPVKTTPAPAPPSQPVKTTTPTPVKTGTTSTSSTLKTPTASPAVTPHPVSTVTGTHSTSTPHGHSGR